MTTPEPTLGAIRSTQPLFSSPYSLGLIFVILVSLLWVLSSAFVQLVLLPSSSNDNENDQGNPFWITYVGSSSFLVLLPLHYLSWWRGKISNESSTHGQNHHEDHHQDSARRRYQDCQRTATEDDDAAAASPNLFVEMNEMAEPAATVSSSEMPMGTSESSLLSGRNATRIAATLPNNRPHDWTFSHHWNAALQITPGWFLANWWYNIALQNTSLASTTVLVSTNGVFCYLLAMALTYCGGYCCFGARNGNSNNATAGGDGNGERLVPSRLLGVILCVLGTALTAQHDSTSNENDNENENDNTDSDNLRGDVYAVLAAAAFGAYALQVRILCPQDESLYRMELLLGCIGLCIQAAVLPVALLGSLWQWLTQNNEGMLGGNFSNVSSLGMMFARGLVDYVLSEYLFFRAVVLTDATVASVGLGLIIPMGFVADLLLGNAALSTASVVGALTVLAGFVLVNLGHA